ncbi:hypothetical protein EHN06_14645 [Marinobacter sp. NP-4(2019)]|uniref:hypothetical protein n=1 Tax=Marinobacter sp. NP-4(2019) TaxID=2488665 RepID=UPI000FC3EA54|nr:hypothetical protein [Marinobacter sp. NP-4(2019)]AZT84686.1 hypothetical protein EHN06_14645 [Marinobacter sp. NP-4(2019)]
MESWLTALEASALATALRNSVWLYPLVNAGHILGVALLVGGIVPLDLRLLGLWRNLPLAPFWQVLRITSATGLVVAAVCGTLLFSTRATEYAASPWFQAKMLVVLLAVTNALWLAWCTRGSGPWKADVARLPAAISLLAWGVALGLGRLLGYF